MQCRRARGGIPLDSRDHRVECRIGLALEGEVGGVHQACGTREDPRGGARLGVEPEQVAGRVPETAHVQPSITPEHQAMRTGEPPHTSGYGSAEQSARSAVEAADEVSEVAADREAAIAAERQTGGVIEAARGDAPEVP